MPPLDHALELAQPALRHCRRLDREEVDGERERENKKLNRAEEVRRGPTEGRSCGGRGKGGGWRGGSLYRKRRRGPRGGPGTWDMGPRVGKGKTWRVGPGKQPLRGKWPIYLYVKVSWMDVEIWFSRYGGR